MSLDLSPQAESILEREANRAGVSVDTLIERTFTPNQPPQPAPAETPKQTQQPAATQALLSLPKEEIARRNAPLLALLEAQLAEAANATPEEIAQADAEWLAFQQNMDAPRRANGERLLFPDVPPRP